MASQLCGSRCPLGLAGLADGSCQSCPARALGLTQGIVAGGYTYVDSDGTLVTVQYPNAAQSASESQLQTFLASTSPFFGLAWQWVFLAAAIGWFVSRKPGRG